MHTLDISDSLRSPSILMCGGYKLCRWCYELLRTERTFAVITRSTRALIVVECVKMLTSTELFVTMRLTVRVISLEVRLM